MISEKLILTQWFTYDVLPVRKGVYQRSPTGLNPNTFAYWDGQNWYVSADTISGARRYYRLKQKSIMKTPNWRGIAAHQNPST